MNEKMTMEEVLSKILEADTAYYSTGKSTMSDQEYDAYKAFISNLDPEHPILAKIGDKPASPWKKAQHIIPMGSLNNVFNEEEFRKWASKFPTETQYTAQPKLDGASLEIIYEKGKMVRAITRGDGTEGEDITTNALLMKNVPHELAYNGCVRGEIMLSKEDFKKINSILPDTDKYKNPRNAASGICRRLDGRFCQYLVVIPYDHIYAELEEFGIDQAEDEDLKIEVLQRLGFKVPAQITGNVDKMVQAYSEVKKGRDGYTYGIDGLVVKVCSGKIQVEAGSANNRPRAQIAWKFDPPGALTVFREESWDVGRTGVITPVAELEPVEIDGSTISRVTLHNIAEIERLDIGRGDTVMVVKAGDIIPKITRVVKHVGNPIPIPTHCPACGTEVNNDGTRLLCPSELCPRKNFNRILNYIKVTKIDGLGKSLVKILFDKRLIKDSADLYKLKEDDIASLEGWGPKSARAIIENINKARSLDAVTFLTAVGIPSISSKTVEDLVKWLGPQVCFVPDNDLLNTLTVEKLCERKGFSTISAEKTLAGLREFKGQIKKLLEHVKIITEEESGGLSGKSFCFTGSMAKPRSFYQDLVKKTGGKNDASITKTTTYLVCNEDKGSSKTQKAMKYGTQIINEAQFLKMIGDVPEEPQNSYKIENISLF